MSDPKILGVIPVSAAKYSEYEQYPEAHEAQILRVHEGPKILRVHEVPARILSRTLFYPQVLGASVECYSRVSYY